MIPLEHEPPPPVYLRPQVALAVLLAHIVVRRDPKRLRAFLTRVSRAVPPATKEEATRARSHVVGASLRCAGPRCLERSVATALLCRMRGSWPDWCTGVALEPFRAHAWVEAEGSGVGEDERDLMLFTITMRVSSKSPTGAEE